MVKTIKQILLEYKETKNLSLIKEKIGEKLFKGYPIEYVIFMLKKYFNI